ncbi:MAG: hypothetical protein C4332_13850 [Meiothermus sp.]
MMAHFVRKALAQRGVCYIPLKGGSMAPTLRSGDLVKVVRQAWELVGVNDIIAFEAEGGVTVHRVRYHTGQGVITAGDANILSDEPISKDQYLGVATERLRSGLTEMLSAERPIDRTTENTFIYQVLVPPSLFAALTQPQKYINFQVFEADIPPASEVTPQTAVGISVYGLCDETWLGSLLRAKPITQIVYSFPFGPEPSGLFPVNRVAAVVRLGVLSDSSEVTLRRGLDHLDGYLGAVQQLEKVKVYG